tara:strand:- start:1162 stop:1395 length:234 start_codon:yes stop_codon:yes gene_type:complete
VPTEEGKARYTVGTLIDDMGKIGVISKILQSGALQTKVASINWRLNYEICYIDGDIQIIGEFTFIKLVDTGTIKILS